MIEAMLGFYMESVGMMFSESGEKKKVFDKIRFLERNKRLKHYLECSFVVLTGEVKDFDSIQKHYAEYNH